MAVSVCEKAWLIVELTWEPSVMGISLYFVWGFMHMQFFMVYMTLNIEIEGQT